MKIYYKQKTVQIDVNWQSQKDFSSSELYVYEQFFSPERFKNSVQLKYRYIKQSSFISEKGFIYPF